MMPDADTSGLLSSLCMQNVGAGEPLMCTVRSEATESAFKMKEKVTVNGKDAEITAGGKKIITQADFTFAFRVNSEKRDGVATTTLAKMIERAFSGRKKGAANPIPF